MEIEIDTGIPLGRPLGGVKKPDYVVLRAAMAQLLIGSSFFYPCATRAKEIYTRNAVWRLASADKQFVGWKIATRRVFENQTMGIRTWRTA